VQGLLKRFVQWPHWYLVAIRMNMLVWLLTYSA
jgi:hypothetical protein